MRKEPLELKDRKGNVVTIYSLETFYQYLRNVNGGNTAYVLKSLIMEKEIRQEKKRCKNGI
jgi:hypothetical protein